MGDEIERASVEVVCCHNVVTCLQDVLQGVGHGCRTAGYGQSGHASLQRCHALLEDALCGVGKSAIDVARIAQAEAVGCVLRIAEHVRGGLIDRHGACVGGGVGLFLSYVELQCLEVKFVRFHKAIVVFSEYSLLTFDVAKVE